MVKNKEIVREHDKTILQRFFFSFQNNEKFGIQILRPSSNISIYISLITICYVRIQIPPLLTIKISKK